VPDFSSLRAISVRARILAFALAYVAIAFLVSSPYTLLMLTLVPIWATLGVSWNIFSGYSGLISFGHAAFFGLGAYTVALMAEKFGVTPWIGIPLASLIGALSGIVIGVPTFRLRGHYFALAMLAYPLGLMYVFEWLGFQEVALPMHREAPLAYMQFADPRYYVVMATLLLVLALLINLRISSSRFGLSLLAIKQNELAANAAGINPFRWKMGALVLSGALAGAAGGVYAVVLLIVSPPAVFGSIVSAQAAIFAMFGGVGTIAGPIIGAFTLVPASEYLSAQLGGKLPGIQGVTYGVAIILVITLAPEGVLAKITALFRRRQEGGQQSGGGLLQATLQPVAAGLGSPKTDEVALSVQGLGKRFGGLQAVQDVSFEVHRGEILGIIGPNGAGKTTMFNLINGIIAASAGSVLYEGRDIVRLAPFQICRLGIARTFQVARPFPRLSVLQNVVVGAFATEPDDQRAYAAAREAIAQVGLEQDAQALAGGLSTLQLRLMELARALASRPKVLLLDEVLAGLGAQEVEHVMVAIQNIRARGITILIIEHTMHAMVRLADRLLVLDHGTVLALGEPGAVTSQEEVISAYLGKKWSARAQR
jgi:ABC-type branched-subunit amino acid transport system ATPase component/ABC-type branched-subunit amino acid transport system permease subunit